MSSLKIWIASGLVASLFACGGSNNGGNNTSADASNQGSGSGSGAGSGSGSGTGSGSGSGHGLSGSATGTAYTLTGDNPDAQTEAIAYAVGVTIGGSQNFLLDVDTGSTTLGVAGSTCTQCGVSPEYTPGATATKTGKKVQAQYLSGGWDGTAYSDTVGLMGDTTPVTMDFAEITSQTNFFQSPTNQQGIIGLAKVGAALANTDSYLDKRGADSIAFQLCPTDGTMWVDGSDPSTMTQQFQNVSMLTNPDFYQIQVDSGSIDGKDASFSGTAVLDTGTTIMVVSTAAATAISSDLTASSGYQAVFGTQDPNGSDCLDPGSYTREEVDQMLPPFNYTINGQQFSAPASQSYFLISDGAYCFAVEGEDLSSEGTDLLLGDMFLRNFIVNFDIKNQQVGLAQQFGCVLPPEAKPTTPRTGPVKKPHWRRHQFAHH